MQLKNVCVCGAGTMGRGIAHVTASAGYPTILYEPDNTVLLQAQESLYEDLKKLVAKGKLAAEKRETILQQLTFTANLQQCIASLVIEAIVENANVKQDLFRQLAGLNTAETIFASNTSSLSITQLAAAFNYPQQMAGLHFFNPAPVMKLVEVVCGEKTTDDVLQTLVTFVKTLGKTPVVCSDRPGFIVNRVARPFYIEALRQVEENNVTFEMADRLLENAGFKMGPFRLMDLIGNDVNYAVSCSVYEQLNKPERLKPSPLQKNLVDNGRLGKKTGTGYYNY